MSITKERITLGPPSDPVYPGPKHPPPAKQAKQAKQDAAKPAEKLTKREFDFWEQAFIVLLETGRWSVWESARHTDAALDEWRNRLGLVEQGDGPYR